NFTYNPGVNTLQKVDTGGGSLIQDFTYDATGNQLTAGSTRVYIWTAANRLLIYKNQAGSSDPTIFAQYDYDGGGNRVSKLVRTGTAQNPVYERTIYIDGIFEYCKLENGSTYEKNYVHVMDDQSRIAMVRVGQTFPDDIADVVTYNLEDQIGSSTVRLNTTGAVIDKEEFYPFGDSSLRTFTKKRYRYVGKEKDLESGLYYYGARYYSSWLCRFISVDPLAGKFAHLSPYNYASNNPVNHLDIDGMQNPAESASKQGNQGKSEIKQANIVPSAAGKALAKPDVAKIHAVQKGETLSEISDKYGIKTDQLRDANNLDPKNDGNLQIGQKLNIPTKTASKFDSTQFKVTAVDGKTGFYFNKTSYDYKAENKWGYFSGNATGSNVEGQAYGNASWTGAEAGASYSTASGQGEIVAGYNKNTSITLGANGSILSAQANVKAKAMTGDNGKYGATFGANAGAYAVEGQATAGASLFGYKVTVSTGGSVASAHVGADAAAYYDSHEGKIVLGLSGNLGFLVGVQGAAKIEIPLGFNY
ncbi:MAG: LysM peptidoglycan-binding domain-containing protein, partial [Bacteroidetes bacterium]|nr:LysM peptidoglycan-binding domain-containing protein [Bacteroidota bacterium]